MKSPLLLAWTLLLAARLLAQETERPEPAPVFRSIDLYLDASQQPLAAYQVELAVARGNVQFVGVEGGQPPAFRSPPFFDPKALRRERLILAAYHIKTPQPTGTIRVATIHFQTTGHEPPQFTVKVQAAATAAGQKIPVTATVVERKSE